MSKLERFMGSAGLIAVATWDHILGVDVLAIPLAIIAILALGSILKEELGL